MDVFQEWQMACPQCGDDSDLVITASTRVVLTKRGTSDDHSHGSEHEWDISHACYCGSCEWSGTVGDTEVANWKLTPAADLAQLALDTLDAEEDSVREDHEDLLRVLSLNLQQYQRNEISQFLTLSTGHLDSVSRSWLREIGNKNQTAAYNGHDHGGKIGTLGSTLHGWFCIVMNPCADIPPVLATIFNRARKLACSHILFDADGPRDENLPWHEIAVMATSFDAAIAKAREVRLELYPTMFEVDDAPFEGDEAVSVYGPDDDDPEDLDPWSGDGHEVDLRQEGEPFSWSACQITKSLAAMNKGVINKAELFALIDKAVHACSKSVDVSR